MRHQNSVESESSNFKEQDGHKLLKVKQQKFREHKDEWRNWNRNKLKGQLNRLPSTKQNCQVIVALAAEWKW